MIFCADLDKDGIVSKDEFMRIMKKMKLIWWSKQFMINKQFKLYNFILIIYY